MSRVDFPGSSVVKNPPAMQEMRIQSLDWESPLEKGMATCSSILAWRISRTRGVWWAMAHEGHKELDMIEQPNNNKN